MSDDNRPWWAILCGYDDQKKPYITHLTNVPHANKLDASFECSEYIQHNQLNPDLGQQSLFLCKKLPGIHADLAAAVDKLTMEVVSRPALLIDGQAVPILVQSGGKKKQ